MHFRNGADTQRLHQSPQALCIVNTRRHARELYERMADAEGAAHLTTLMCARHRREKLDKDCCFDAMIGLRPLALARGSRAT